MDDLLGIVIGLVLLALFVGGIVLPIIALVVSIRTRIKLNRTISRLESLQPFAAPSTPKLLSDAVQQLTVRVARLEAAMKVPRTAAPPKPAEERPPETVTPRPPAE